MKRVQVCVKNGYDRSKYYDVIIDNKQTKQDAVNIIKRNLKALYISPLAFITATSIQPVDQFGKYKPGTILDGDWNSYCFGEVLIEGGE